MTLGENIRRLRKERKMSLKELGRLVGVSETYMRAYEVGDRHPKADKIEKIARALRVSPESLLNSDFNRITAMHRLFQIFRRYRGELTENEEGEVFLSFGTLAVYMRVWFDRYEEYQKELEECNKIKDTIQRAEALVDAENKFLLWMDTFPGNEIPAEYLDLMERDDRGMDYLGLHPLNDPDYPMTEKEKRMHNKKAKELFNKKTEFLE